MGKQNIRPLRNPFIIVDAIFRTRERILLNMN